MWRQVMGSVWDQVQPSHKAVVQPGCVDSPARPEEERKKQYVYSCWKCMQMCLLCRYICSCCSKKFAHLWFVIYKINIIYIIYILYIIYIYYYLNKKPRKSHEGFGSQGATFVFFVLWITPRKIGSSKWKLLLGSQTCPSVFLCCI